jgi:hypothetical protein
MNRRHHVKEFRQLVWFCHAFKSHTQIKKSIAHRHVYTRFRYWNSSPSTLIQVASQSVNQLITDNKARRQKMHARDFCTGFVLWSRINSHRTNLNKRLGKMATKIEAGTWLNRDPVIAFVPPNLKLKGRVLKDIPLDELDWPEGRPENLHAKTVAELGPQDHILTFPHFWVYGKKANISPVNLTLMIIEPRAYHWKHIWMAKRFYRRFYRVLGYDQSLLVKVPNSIHLIGTFSFVPNWAATDCTKTRMLSLIASKKKSLVGHKLRHRVVRKLRTLGVDVDVMGGGYRPFDEKSDGLASYRYSMVIENSRQLGYFTEKLIDALLLKTVPVYWGAPDIRTFFDPRGIIVCQTEADMYKALETMSEKDYADRLPFLEANLQSARKYMDYRIGAAQAIRDTF